MNDDRCQRYLEDPETNAAHIEECAECRALQVGLDQTAGGHTLDVANLPLAPWEGASHRPWPLIIGGVLAVIAVAIGLCLAAGISPAMLLQNGWRQIGAARAIADNGARWFSQSMFWRVVFAVIFLAVNALLIVLLRRAPRGVDA